MPLETLQSIHLNRQDGSGVILRQMYFQPILGRAIQVFETFTGRSFPCSIVSEENLRKAAAKMGKGVEYVNHKPDQNAAGWEGFNAVYQFRDINQLKVDITGIQASVKSSSGSSKKKKQREIPTEIRFYFAEDELNIILPDIDFDCDDDDDSCEDCPPDEWNGQPFGWLAKIIGGFRTATAIILDSDYRKTTASYAQGNSIVLVDFALGALLTDPDIGERFRKMGQVENFAGVVAAIGELDGIKIESKPVIRVEF